MESEREQEYECEIEREREREREREHEDERERDMATLGFRTVLPVTWNLSSDNHDITLLSVLSPDAKLDRQNTCTLQHVLSHVGERHRLTVNTQTTFIQESNTLQRHVLHLCLHSYSSVGADLLPIHDIREPVSMCSNRESGHRHGTTYTHVYAALPYRAAESGHTPQVREGVGMVSSGYPSTA